MSTVTNPPANAMKGNLRGQTTLAAKIDRWQKMSDNVQPQLAAFPQLKDFHTEFQKVIDEAQALRSQMKAIAADSLSTVARRNDLIRSGEDLFARLSHGLKSALGPKSERLVQYGVKRGKAGRKAKTAQPTPGPSTPPPTQEAQGSKADPGHPGK